LVRDVPTTSDRIRALAKAGHSRVEISKLLGKSYQHVRKVLLDAGITGGLVRQKKASQPSTAASTVPPRKFRSEFLLRGGFQDIGEWTLTDDRAISPPRAPAEPGVYAFVLDDVVVYIGSTLDTLQGRLTQYAKPGNSQETNKRLKGLICDSLKNGRDVGVLVATPGSCQWNGLPVMIAPGLEAGLIQRIRPKWNIRGSG